MTRILPAAVAQVLVAVVALAGCGATGDRIPYEIVPPEQLPAQVSAALPVRTGSLGSASTEPASTGIAAAGGYTYAFIVAGANQEIEIVSVEKADVGIDVRYSIQAANTKATSMNTAPQIRLIKFRNLLSVPVGFKKR